MNKLELAKAVREVSNNLKLSGTNERDEIANAFDYLADLIEGIEDEPQLVGGTDVSTPELGDLRDRGDVECGTSEPVAADRLTFRRWGGAREIYRVWYTYDAYEDPIMLGLVERLENSTWKAIVGKQDNPLFTFRLQAAHKVAEEYQTRTGQRLP